MATELSGATLPLVWALPFAGLLVSIAVVPLISAGFWHAHYGKVALAWTLGLVVPYAVTFGAPGTLHLLVDSLLRDYVPFIAILFALFVIAGGISVRGTLGGTPVVNTTLLALGTVLASVMGTTGASMLLIRPLITANEGRTHRAHTVVFFILLVGNVGGALSPIGDPPLFIGFLKGVDFFWPTRALAAPTLFVAVALLGVYFALDTILHRRRAPPPWAGPARRAYPKPVELERLGIEGARNLLLLAAVIAVVLISGFWNPGVSFTLAGVEFRLQDVTRSLALLALGVASLAITPRAVRAHNQFHWKPIVEVAKLFAAIFVTVFPVLVMLAAGRDGPLGGLVNLVGNVGNAADAGDVVDVDKSPNDVAVFWLTGAFSAFLDNAPTYLVVFNLAGGDARRLMDVAPMTLGAISMGAVYFGALTYIGNAPNFLVKTIAEDRGVTMPSFFAYMGYAAIAMLPLLGIVSLIWI
jgi:Na+/H+ antiporter NhaD/arsenite permease-like protein